MANFNKVILAGNLTRDPELRYTPKGTAIAKFGLAVNRTWTGEDGQKHEEATFVDIDCFGKQAEVISQYLRKGRSILIEGRLKLDQWDDKQTGQKRSKLGVVLESFSFIDSNREGGAGGGGGAPAALSAQVARPARPARPAASAPPPVDQGSDEPPQGDDVPF